MILELFLLAAIFLFYAVLKDRKPKTLPPGPAEIPFFGNKGFETHEEMDELRKTYGDMFTTRLGVVRMVTVCDYQLAKEAMSSLECSDRSSLFKIFNLYPDEQGGLLTSSGFQWVHDRRFVLRHLRDLGMGKTYIETAIQEEARELVDRIKDLGEKPSKYPKCFRAAVLNVIWQLVAGERYDQDSPVLRKTYEVFDDFRDIQTIWVFAEEFFPVLKTIIPKFIRRHLFKTTLLDTFRVEMIKLLDERVAEHRKTLEANSPRDLIDDYLIESDKEADNPNSFFRTKVLYQIVSELFAAGSDTVTTMLSWTCFLMAKYPDIVKRCQEEIDREVGSDHMVSILDKSRLSYVEAFTAEAMRYATLLPFSLARVANKDYKLGGYLLPKGTSVQISSYTIHFEKKFWGDPENFRPDRFLDSEGKFQAKLGRAASFGMGRRQCLGEPLARMEFFLFTAAILQNFNIEVPKGKTLDDRIIESLAGGRFPVTQEYVYRSRKL